MIFQGLASGSMEIAQFGLGATEIEGAVRRGDRPPYLIIRVTARRSCSTISGEEGRGARPKRGT